MSAVCRQMRYRSSRSAWQLGRQRLDDVLKAVGHVAPLRAICLNQSAVLFPAQQGAAAPRRLPSRVHVAMHDEPGKQTFWQQRVAVLELQRVFDRKVGGPVRRHEESKARSAASDQAGTHAVRLDSAWHPRCGPGRTRLLRHGARLPAWNSESCRYLRSPQCGLSTWVSRSLGYCR